MLLVRVTLGRCQESQLRPAGGLGPEPHPHRGHSWTPWAWALLCGLQVPSLTKVPELACIFGCPQP